MLYKYKTNVSLIGIVLFCTCFMLLPSYVLHYYLNADVRYLYGIFTLLCIGLLFVKKKGIRISIDIFKIILAVLFVGAIASLISGAYTQMLMSLSLSIAIIIIDQGWRYIIFEKSLRVLNYYCMLLLIGALIGSIYSILGGNPIDVVYLYSGEIKRTSFVYLTTISDFNVNGFIKPAAIFDEPGAFAMFIMIVVSINEIYEYNNKSTLTLLSLGLITGSLYLAIAFFIYMGINFSGRKKVAIYFVLFTLVILVNNVKIINDMYDLYFGSRLAIVDGKMVGDNRSEQIDEFFEIIDKDIVLKGANVVNSNINVAIDQSSNPLSILYGYGIFMWFIYLALEIWLLYAAIKYTKRLRYPALIMFLTLLQRPYLFNIYWLMMIVLVVYSIHKKQNPGYMLLKSNNYTIT